MKNSEKLDVSDLKITVEELESKKTKNFYLTKGLLEIRCPLFLKEIKSVAPPEEVYKMTLIRHKSLDLFLQYIYCGVFPNLYQIYQNKLHLSNPANFEHLLVDLLTLSTKFCVPHIFNCILFVLQDNYFSVQNVCSLIQSIYSINQNFYKYHVVDQCDFENDHKEKEKQLFSQYPDLKLIKINLAMIQDKTL